MPKQIQTNKLFLQCRFETNPEKKNYRLNTHQISTRNTCKKNLSLKEHKNIMI